MVSCPICGQTVAREDKKTDVNYLYMSSYMLHGKCLIADEGRLASQKPTASDATSQLLMTAIQDLTAEIKGLKFTLDANANEVKELKITLEKETAITHENAEKLNVIEILLDIQTSKLEGLKMENATLRSGLSELETRLNRTEQMHLSRSIEIRGVR
ncbi:unnamed protein product [Nezara viridula]|uniref:Uncharacterized protein n=1 Tax=Nezara viridula TaxID=85310 RepID=A0A9P0EBQ2_NEZVI|nr:unnamed protein product [Nezara viridula]